MKSKFAVGGKDYQLPLKNNGNSLHGRGKGFDKRKWKEEKGKSRNLALSQFGA